MSEQKIKVLILCVDRDNDIGDKCGIETPIIGRDENLEAASKLGLKDPEEADANTMFSAVKTYDDLKITEKNDEYQVATIAGSKLEGITADKRIGDQLVEILKKFPAESVILITDGFADETVVPIIQSHRPIRSVKRVVVKHSESIEESWALFSRYIKILIKDPYYSRWALGVPGILLMILAILTFVSVYYPPLNLLPYAGIVTLMFLGIAASIKGFGIDRTIASLYIPKPPNLIKLFSTTVGIVIIAVDIYQTFVNLTIKCGNPSTWLNVLPRVVGYAIGFSADLIVIATCVFLAGRGIYFFLTRDSRVWWTIVGVVVSAWIREVLYKTAAILKLSVPPGITEGPVMDLIFVVILGMATTAMVVFITFRLDKKFTYYFSEGEAETSEKS